MTETTIQTEKEKQKIYNQKWLSKLTPEKRKEYFRTKARERRGWKCANCGKSLVKEKSYKDPDTKTRLCENCTAQNILKSLKEKKELS